MFDFILFTILMWVTDPTFLAVLAIGTAINLFDPDDEPLTIRQACKVIPGRPTFQTVWRWCMQGRNGVRLQYIECGRRKFTTRRALQEFFEKSTVEPAD